MRRRLLGASGLLLSVLLLALMAPLVNAYAEDRTQDLFVSRFTDATRFAVLAEDSLEGDGFGGLITDLERYAEVYGGTVVVTNANRDVVASSRPAVDVERPEIAAVVDRALSGSGTPPPDTFWPWVDRPFVLGSPVGRDAQVLGSVVMVAPTDPVQQDVGRWLLWLTLAGLSTLVLTGYGLAGPFVGWILRPVHELDLAAKRLAHGDVSTRVPSGTGPPELRDLARSFNVMADHVETSQQQQRDLIADASHQLGNPLTALRLRIENLEATTQTTPEIEHALEETDRLNRIVGSLLDLSQVGSHTTARVPVDVARQARHRCALWSHVFDCLTARIPPSAVAVAGEDIVDMVLDALLDNAAKFAAGAPVEVGVEGGPEDVVLTVRDHGPGLHEEDVAKVGARFFRGRRHQNVSGTGLGLAIVRARVVDVGGQFAVAPAPGGGLRVEVRFPAVSSAAPGSNGPHPGADPGER